MGYKESFECTQRHELPEYGGIGRWYVHRGNGCEVYHIECADPENLFAFCFKTPSRDNSGLAHIIEHVVLCGSERFSVKDPFLNLLKSSACTFLNAMTGNDGTVYVASSAIERDLFNVMEVYADAVFFPLLRETSFLQEGVRYEYEEGRLNIGGVVYNEMSAQEHMMENVVYDWSVRRLLEDTAYRFDSGGVPAEMRGLPYEELVERYRSWYTPSNCRIFLYGNIAVERYLEFLDALFVRYGNSARAQGGHVEGRDGGAHSSREVMAVQLQPSWDAPRRHSYTYGGSAQDDPEGATAVMMSWLLPEVADAEGLMALRVLSRLLMGHSGSPLRRAIVDSDICADMLPMSGLRASFRQGIMMVGVRGVKLSQVDAVERLILGELERMRESGELRAEIKAAMQIFEFTTREVVNTMGLRLLHRVLCGWFYGDMPDAHLPVVAMCERLRAKIERSPDFFEQLLGRYLLDNRHRLTVVAAPDKDVMVRSQQEIAAHLVETEKRIGTEEQEKLKENQRRLRLMLDTDDAVEEVEKIPVLSRADVPTQVRSIGYETEMIDEAGAGDETGALSCMWHHGTTNGIVYVRVAFELADIPSDMQEIVSLYAMSLTELGLTDKPAALLMREIAECSGGIKTALESGSHLDDPRRSRAYFVIKIKGLENHCAQMVSLLGDILTKVDIECRPRLGAMLTEEWNDLRSDILPAGHHIVAQRAAGALSPAMSLQDRWEGIAQLDMLSHYLSPSSTTLVPTDEYVEAMRQIHTDIVGRAPYKIAITCEERGRQRVRTAIGELCRRITEWRASISPQSRGAAAQLKGEVPLFPRSQMLQAVSPLNYVGVVLRGSRIDDAEYAAEVLFAHILRTGLLWEYIRMRGGAYGATAFTQGSNALFCIATYRDPNVNKTLEAIHTLLQSLAHDEIPQREVDQAVVAHVGKEDRPLAPATMGNIAFIRSLFGVDDVLRQQIREAMLRVTPSDLCRVAERCCARWGESAVCVLGGEQGISEAARYGGRNFSHITLPL